MNKLNGKITKSATMRGALTGGAGGGTYVEANPEGEAIDTLEKLMVESDIFKIRNVPDASSAQNGDVLTKTANGAAWAPLPESGITYSTDEQEIGTWIDGKKLYQKTFNLSERIVSDNNWTNNLLGTYNTNISIKYYEGYFGLDTTNSLLPYSYFRSTSEYFTSVINSTGDDLNIRPNMNAGVSVKAGIVTIKYTKVGE